MATMIVPGATGNTNLGTARFDSGFARACSTDMQSCVTTGAQERNVLTPETAAVAQPPAARPTKELSGADWVEKFPGSKSVDDLAPVFKESVTSFLAAVKAAGGRVSIAATYRPPERAYMMHYAWDISTGKIRADRVPAMAGVNIEWDHGTTQKSKNAASAMVSGFGMQHRGALASRHTERKAIDMNITGMNGKSILNKEGTSVKIGGAGDLHAVGATYGVIKLVTDPPHWSEDGD